MALTKYGKSYTRTLQRGTSGIANMAKRAAAAYMGLRAGQAVRRFLAPRRESTTTVQHDVTTQYRRKRMPRRKRKRWVKFVKKVQRVEENSFPTQVIVLSNQLGVPNANYTQFPGARKQGFALVGELYSLAGSADPERDMTRLVNYAQTQYSSLPTSRARNIHITSAVMDITINNQSIISLNGDSNYIPITQVPLELDLYILRIKKAGANNSHQTFGSLVSDAIASVNPAAGSIVTTESLGTTPFEFNVGQEYAQIVEKKKYFVSYGQSITYQYKDAKSRWINYDQVKDNEGGQFEWYGKTVVACIVYKLPPLITNVGGVTNSSVISPLVTIGCTRKYSFRAEGITSKGYAYNP